MTPMFDAEDGGVNEFKQSLRRTRIASEQHEKEAGCACSSEPGRRSGVLMPVGHAMKQTTKNRPLGLTPWHTVQNQTGVLLMPCHVMPCKNNRHACFRHAMQNKKAKKKTKRATTDRSYTRQRFCAEPLVAQVQQ